MTDILYRKNAGSLTLLANQTSPTSLAGVGGDSFEVWLSRAGKSVVVPASSSGITVEGSSGVTVGSGTGTEVKTIPGTPAENDIVLVLRGNDFALNTNSISGYTLVVDDGGVGSGYKVEYKRMGATPDTTVTIPQYNGFVTACIILLVRGVNTTTALDAAVPTVAEATAASITPPAITTVTNNAMVVVMSVLDDDNATSVTAYPSGYINTTFHDAGGGDTANSSVAVGTKIVATAGTETPGSFTWNKDDAIKGITFALRPA